MEMKAEMGTFGAAQHRIEQSPDVIRRGLTDRLSQRNLLDSDLCQPIYDFYDA